MHLLNNLTLENRNYRWAELLYNLVDLIVICDRQLTKKTDVILREHYIKNNLSVNCNKKSSTLN